MAVKLGSLRADMRKVNEGEWVEIPDLPDGEGGLVVLLVRGFAYGPYQADNSIMRGKWARRYENRNEPVPPEVATKDLAHLYAKHLLIGWKGFDERYNPELAEDMLASPGEFFGHVLWAVQQVSRTEVEFVEGAAKNSGRSSAGSSKTTPSEPG